MAAYAARTGVRAIVVVPSGEIAMNKLSQALMYGAKVVAPKGHFRHGPRNGPRTGEPIPCGAHELCQPPPDRGAEDSGLRGDRGAGRTRPTTSFCRSATRATSPRTGRASASSTRPDTRSGCRAWSARRPKGPPPIVTGHPVEHPTTVASAIRIGNPASWEGATSARDESGGAIAAVTDTEILSAQVRLAGSEGFFCGTRVRSAARAPFPPGPGGSHRQDATTVVVLTGSGSRIPMPRFEECRAPD